MVFFIDPFNIRAGERVGNFIKANQVAENRVGTVWWQNLKKSTKSSLTLAKIHISQYLANAIFWQMSFIIEFFGLPISFINVIFWAKIAKKIAVML